MTTKITFIFDNPTDPDAFEAGYPELIDSINKISDVQQIETSKVWPKEDGSPTPAYRMIDLYFTDYESASAAVTTPEFGVVYPKVLELATGGMRALFSKVDES